MIKYLIYVPTLYYYAYQQSKWLSNKIITKLGKNY